MGVLESARKVDDYLAKNNFSYSNSDGETYNAIYDLGTSKKVNEDIYVYWCLVDAGIIKSDNEFYSGLVARGWDKKSFFDLDSHEKKLYIAEYLNNNGWDSIVGILDLSDLQEGDVCFYKEGDNTYHINIYAGNSKFWEVNNDEDIKKVGPTTRNDLPKAVARFKNPDEK